MDKEAEKIVGICKPTYEEIESEYGRMADRCEFAEKLNKSLERVIVEKDNTIESFAREIEDLEKIIREKDMIVKSLTDENCELKKELAKLRLNNTFSTMMDSAGKSVMSYKDWLINRGGLSATEVISVKLKDAKEIVNLADHRTWEIVVVNGDNICTQRIGYKNITKYIFHVSDYRKTWIFVDDKEEVKSNEHNNS